MSLGSAEQNRAEQRLRVQGATLWKRYHHGRPSLPHATQGQETDGEVVLRVGHLDSSPLLELRVTPSPAAPGGALVALKSPLTQLDCALAELESQPPDALWEVVDEICRHMEEDHPDTFGWFLRMAESTEESALGMPWVQSDGLYLSTAQGPVFVPFPEECLSGDAVRRSMIAMLRKARAAHG